MTVEHDRTGPDASSSTVLRQRERSLGCCQYTICHKVRTTRKRHSRNVYVLKKNKNNQQNQRVEKHCKTRTVKKKRHTRNVYAVKTHKNNRRSTNDYNQRVERHWDKQTRPTANGITGRKRQTSEQDSETRPTTRLTVATS